jgi:hypothetical protein
VKKKNEELMEQIDKMARKIKEQQTSLEIDNSLHFKELEIKYNTLKQKYNAVSHNKIKESFNSEQLNQLRQSLDSNNKSDFQQALKTIDTFANEPSCQLQIWKLRCHVMSEKYMKIIGDLKDQLIALKGEVRNEVAKKAKQLSEEAMRKVQEHINNF